MSIYSRYNEIKSGKIPHRKRTTSIKGSGDDSGKWFRCWNCGFINNIDRNSVGEGDGSAYSLSVMDNDIVATGTSAHMLGVSGTSSLMGPGPAVNSLTPEALSGCSFCGSRNYR